MSVDPTAAAPVGAQGLAALVEAELQALADAAAALSDLLSAGDVVQARVLPSNGLTDQIEIAGQRVAAQLPPTLRPGDVITVQVVGFEDGQVQVTILPDAPPPGSAPPGSPPPPVPQAPVAPAASAPPSSAPPSSAPPASAPPAAPVSVAPSSAVFAAAAVRPAPPIAPAPAPPPAPAASAPPPTATPVADAAPPPSATAVPPPLANGIPAERTESPNAALGGLRIPRAPLPTADPSILETRLAAARTTPAGPLQTAPPAAPRSANPAPPAAPPPPNAPPPSRPFVAPPIVTRAAAPGAQAPAAAASQRPAAAAPPAEPSASAPPTLAPRGLALYADPVALLRSLRLPVTPTNVASAQLALQSPDRLANALAVLQRALPSSTDPRIATLQTLTAFVSRLSPNSPVLATQIAAFVDQVLTGAEPKLATALAALADAEPSPFGEKPDPNAPTPASPATPSSPAPPAPAPPASSGTPAQAQHAAVAAERQTALQYDLKAQLLSVAASPPAGSGEELANAVGQALTALTALQVSTANALAAAPDGIRFALPVALPDGTTRQAQVRIDREAPGTPRTPLDGDNFHIAFVLETRNLGTIAIDLVTVGRTVTVGVKTEAALSARAFSSALGKLTDRLEKLRYTVAKADATVVAPGTASVISTSSEATTPPGTPVDPTKLVDRNA